MLVAKEGESFKESGMRSSASTGSQGGAGSAPGQGSGGGKRALGKAMTKGGLLFKGKGSGSLSRQEEDVRARMATSSETFRKAVLESQALRQEYFNFQLPKILRVSRSVASTVDQAQWSARLIAVAEGMRRRAGHGHAVPPVPLRVPVRINARRRRDDAEPNGCARRGAESPRLV